MRLVTPAAVAAAFLMIATTALAQAPAAPVQQAMRQLMLAEEQYYSDHGTYTTDLSALGLMNQLARKGEPQVWLRIYHAGGAGWIADAQGANGMAGSCVAFVGDLANFASVPATRDKHLKPTEEGVITCDQ